MSVSGFWCEAVAITPDRRMFRLGGYASGTARLAMRWVRGRTRHVAEQVEPSSAQPAWHWLKDDPEHERALSALVQGEPYTFSIFDDGLHYALSAQPSRSRPEGAAPTGARHRRASPDRA